MSEPIKEGPVVRPIVRTGINTEFGELQDDPETLMEAQFGDVLHVPGFSEMRRAYDLAVAEKRTPTPLPVNLRWVRRTKADGKPTNERTSVVQQAEYRPVKFTDIGQPWLTEMPRSAVKLPDGTIGSGDAVLMVQSARAAARSAVRKRLTWQEQNNANATGAFDRAIEKAGLRPLKGVNPESAVEQGTPKTN